MHKVIITGANGFIGSSLTNFLAKKGVTIFAVVRNKFSNVDTILKHENINIIYCDLNHAEQLEYLIEDRDIDVFYHLAWTGASGPGRADYKVQMENVSNSLECAKQSKLMGCKRFIAIGTIGEFMAELAIKNNIISEIFTYAISKNFCHSLLDIYCYNHNIPYTWCTLPGVYGIGDRTSNIINYTIKKLLLKELPEYTKAEQLFDFVYIDDCIKCLFEIGLKNDFKKYYFVGGPSPQPLNKFIETAKNVVSPDSQLGFGIRNEDGIVYKKEWFTMDETIKHLGFKHEFSFEEGIKLTTEWIKSTGIYNS
ncbi:Nucleoside-diphosphate-sugar epimerase [Paenibacillus sophorae]|uniref:NAD(P)-dependent oxidoreductase n=1 Tax=Paenibacillus sophorae TaxID=1333845 RepID=A0A1H8LZX6_9BACL|nr:NAD(P)-dependent oxidoreductase [Paenibacillus sophorae]QWU17615.1 NAD(P)-dependent oxidoreductase [Paenibacillus sophorae]SEO10621.1 Nucleoside-diphosphate-sugar epimerase [Paenibacillus sophorae]